MMMFWIVTTFPGTKLLYCHAVVHFCIIPLKAKLGFLCEKASFHVVIVLSNMLLEQQ